MAMNTINESFDLNTVCVSIIWLRQGSGNPVACSSTGTCATLLPLPSDRSILLLVFLGVAFRLIASLAIDLHDRHSLKPLARYS